VARVLGRHRPLVALQREPVLGLAGDAVLSGHHLGRLAQTDRPAVGMPGIDHPPAQRTVVHGLRSPRERLRHLGQDVGGTGHAFHPARQEEVAVAGFDLAGRRHDRLEAGAAQPVDRGPGHLDRQAGQQNRHPGHVPVVLARLVGSPKVDVLDARRIEVDPPHGFGHHQRRQVIRAYIFEGAAIAADRGA
jgi:hypothetical protein